MMTNEQDKDLHNLGVVPSPDLFNELRKRYICCVFLGIREAEGQKGAGDTEREFIWYGEQTTVYGMLCLGQQRMGAILNSDVIFGHSMEDDDNES